MGGSRALTKMDELLRRAEWERLGEAERTQLLAPYTGRVAPGRDISAGSGSPDRTMDPRLQDWVAQLVATRLQPEVAAVIHDWLATAPPDGHLYIGGRRGQGRTSLVASLARDVMRQRSAPPDYCYVPDVTALDKPALLALPKATGAPFMKSLFGALSQVCQGWSASQGSDDSGQGGSNGSSASSSQPPDRRMLIATAFDSMEPSVPDTARGYISQLRAALEALIPSDDGPPFCSGDSVPAGHVTPMPDDALDSDGAALTSGAPVVSASLAQADLTDVLMRANGGVLVLQAADVADAGTWGTLAGALRLGQVTLKAGFPPLPLNVRVVLVGSGDVYNALDSNSDDFGRLFRYEAWCNYDAVWTREVEAAYAVLADGVASRHGLPKLDASGVARLIEECARRTDGLNRSRLTTSLLVAHDIAVEAGRLAQAKSLPGTTGAEVDGAVARRRTLQSVNQQRVLDAIMTGEEITPTTGTALGQINGLGIYEAHPSEGSFAVPMRISATASPGRDEKLVDVEAVASAADASHVRGALTAEGYLHYRYAQDRQIRAAIRIRFEQEHGGTGGDSASAASVFALLSALAHVPIRCSLAVTGAVGQYGELQPIGGVNTKIEGFWALCRARRAGGEVPTDGGYGVLIPAINARDLMLHPEIAHSIATEGWFHVWGISTIDDGLPLLMGVPAATVHARVEARLKRFDELVRRGH
ncbi:MAG TPA: AAA family ATPase [Ktedonobacterales bacterium]|nr:AAA family ATPase [Ktedonobacterales bacterium]